MLANLTRQFNALVTLLFALFSAPTLAEQISVTHWGVLLYGAPYAVAMERGYFRQAGIDISGIFSSKGGGTTVRNMILGGLPFGEVALSSAIAAEREGLDIRIVCGGVQNLSDQVWVTLPDSPLKTIADLKGKKIGYTTPKSVTDMVTTLVLDHQKITGVERVAVGSVGAQITALQQKAIDAAYLGEPVYSQNKSKFRVLFYARDMLAQNNLTQTVGVTTSEFAKAHPDKVKAIIEGRRRGVEFIYQNPKEAALIVAKAYSFDPAIMEEAMISMAKSKYWSAGELDLAGMNAMAEGLKITGSIDSPPNWNKLIDRSFLKK
jgi:NitT/TauT family transport system substrate-binding protein